MIIEARVNPASGRFSITNKDGKTRILLRSAPEKNKANSELVKELSRLLTNALGRHVHVAVVSGLSSRRKRLEASICGEEWLAFLQTLE